VLATAFGGPASASQALTELNVRLMSFNVNKKGEALITYRRSDGFVRHVFAWGAINARPPTEGVEQIQFKWDWAGGARKYRDAKAWKKFKGACRRYDGPKLALLVAACKAPDGTYWTIQAWQRRLPLLGFDPWLPHQTAWEFHLAHFSGPLPVLEVYPNWTYGGQWQGIFGRHTYLGKPVHGFATTNTGNPLDKYGRNHFIDTYNSVYGPGWKREAGIVSHKNTGTFCHSFTPARPFPGYPSTDMRPPAPGEWHRVTVMGPGVTPVMRTEVKGLTDADRGRDDDFNADFDRVMAGDRICAHER
jgi:hypothetical protein